MKKIRMIRLWVALVGAAWMLPLGARVLDVTQFGAKSDGVTDNTAAIQKAIDECSAEGGGRVLVPGGGVYKTYTLSLKNNVELHIDRGATLKGGEDALKYPEFAPTDVWRSERAPRFNKRAMFYTVGQTNVAITGSGTIDGNAEAFHRRVNGRWERVSGTNITGRCIFFVGCQDVRFEDVKVYHPSGWSTWFLDCDRVQCRGVRIECHHEFPNGDGLHFGGCRDVTVSDCIIDAQDDAIIVRTHQEQMKVPRPCERLAFANCVLRSNACAIRFGWTGDGPIRDVTFDNIICDYSSQGVQILLPPMCAPENIDPPRGRGVVAPKKDEILPFSVENVRFSNMSINSFAAPLCVSIWGTENVAFLRDIAFSNCRFRAQRAPIFEFRPEDNVSNWRFSNVTFEIAKPRDAYGRGDFPSAGVGGGWFENARDVTFDNVKWSFYPQDQPEWTLTLEAMDEAGSVRPITLSGARQICREEMPAPGVRRFVYDRLRTNDGYQSWDVQVEIEARQISNGGTSYRGRVVNKDSGIRVTAFEGPYFERLRLDPAEAALIYANGLGRRVTNFPTYDPKIPNVPERVETDGWNSGAWYRLADGRYTFDTGFYPSASGLSMPWAALETGFGTYYVGAHDKAARPKRLRFRWTPNERRIEAAFDHRFFLDAGDAWEIPETVCENVTGDWHAAARRYRAWYDTVRSVRVATPDWARQISGWLLVIMRQQNEQVFWKYTDIPLLCDIAERNGLDCIGLFGWTKGGHDHLYPDYEPSDEMGGVAALKAGIAEAHRRGLRVYMYANGQLQQVGATPFWKEYGEKLALVRRDGSRISQVYPKYSDIPCYEFSLACLYAKPWYERMYALAEQANSFGADGILYDQLGISTPFACYGANHGHCVPAYSHCEERSAFMRAIADGLQKKNPQFAILTEGLHDSILDSTAIFHGCEFGTFDASVRDVTSRATRGRAADVFPELWRYTFPELVTTIRLPVPIALRDQANYVVTFGCRSEIEARYEPDRAFLVEGKVPTKREDYGKVVDVPNLKALQSISRDAAESYLKSVCDLQRAYGKYLLTGRFVDTEGFTCTNPALVAKRFVAADGTSAVCVWNISAKATDVEIEGFGKPLSVVAPGTEPTTGLLAPNSIRLYIYSAAK
jgi:hypothetical protein